MSTWKVNFLMSPTPAATLGSMLLPTELGIAVEANEEEDEEDEGSIFFAAAVVFFFTSGNGTKATYKQAGVTNTFFLYIENNKTK